MRLVRVRLPIRMRHELLAFGTHDNPESAALEWRRKGEKTEKKWYYLFLKKFQCNAMINLNTPLSVNCMANINNEVNAYNKKLAALVTNKNGKGM